MNNKVVWLVVISAVLLFATQKKKPNSMSGLKRKRRSLGGLGGIHDVKPYRYKGDPSGYIYYIDTESKWDSMSDEYKHQIYEMENGKLVKRGGKIGDHKFIKNYIPIPVEKAKLIPESKGQMTLFGGLGNIGYRELNKITPYKWHENNIGEDEAVINGIKISSSSYGDNALFDVIVNGKAKTAIVQPTKSSINSAIKRLVGYAIENTKKGQMNLFGYKGRRVA